MHVSDATPADRRGGEGDRPDRPRAAPLRRDRAARPVRALRRRLPALQRRRRRPAVPDPRPARDGLHARRRSRATLVPRGRGPAPGGPPPHRADRRAGCGSPQRLRARLAHILDVLDRADEPSGDLFIEAIEVMTRMERYYTPEQLEQLAARRRARARRACERAQEDWARLIAEVEAERAAGTDPADPRLDPLIERWNALVEQFTGGDPGIRASLQRLYETEGPERASRGGGERRDDGVRARGDGGAELGAKRSPHQPRHAPPARRSASEARSIAMRPPRHRRRAGRGGRSCGRDGLRPIRPDGSRRTRRPRRRAARPARRRRGRRRRRRRPGRADRRARRARGRRARRARRARRSPRGSPSGPSGSGRSSRCCAIPASTSCWSAARRRCGSSAAGGSTQTDVRFASEAELRHAIERILAPLGRRADEAEPLCDARLPDGSRVNVVLPPLALDGPLLTIRRFRPRGFAPADLVAHGTLAPPLLDFLGRAVAARCTLLICGGTGSGKTTTLGALAAFVDPAERVVTIEDAAELRLALPARRAAGGAPAEPRGPRRGDDPAARAQRAADAARPADRRRGARAGGARPARRAEHRPRRLALHDPRGQRGRGAAAARDARADGRRRPAARGDPRPDRRRDRPRRAPGARRGRRRAGSSRSREVVRVAGGPAVRELFTIRAGRPAWRAPLGDTLAAARGCRGARRTRPAAHRPRSPPRRAPRAARRRRRSCRRRAAAR